jgi:hypothetical protein
MDQAPVPYFGQPVLQPPDLPYRQT